MRILFIIAIFIVELLKYWIFINGFLKVNIKRKWTAVIGFVIYSLLSISEKIREDDIYLLMYLIVIIVSVITMEAKIVHRIINILLGLLVISCLDGVFGVVQYLWNSHEAGAWKENMIQLNNSIFSLLFIIIMVVTVNKLNVIKRDKLFKFMKKTIPFTVLTLFVALILTISALNYAKGYVENDKFILFVNEIIVISYISIGLLLVFIVYINKTNIKMEEMMETERNLKEMQLNHYKSMLEREEGTRKYRHDMNNHLICLNQLAKKKETEGIADYLDTMQNQMFEIQKIVYSTGNEIIDAILNYHLPMLDKEVQVSINGCFIEKISISNVDLCTIFANLVQNAVEELKKENGVKKYFKMTINSGLKYTQLEIINTLSDQSMKKKDLLTTEKRDKQNHGLGLRNVMETIERNGGKFETLIIENDFIVKVILIN